MQHTVEDLSPVKKKVAVTVPAEQVDAVLDRAVARYRAGVALPGFRKGKAPIGMVEKRFGKEIFGDAMDTILNESVTEAIREMGVEPLGGMEFDGEIKPLERGKDFTYGFTFEIMPDITVPNYEGIGVEQEEVTVSDEEIDDVVNRLRGNFAELSPVEEKRLPVDGDVVTMDFAGFDENGEPVPGVSGEQFQVALGDGQVIPDFEALVRTIAPGDSGEGAVKFPDDYGHAPLAGKTVTMKITAHSLQSRNLPEVDDEFAKKASGLDSVEAMRNSIRDSYARNRKDVAKAKAQTKLLEDLLAKTDFPLPEGLVDRYTQNILHERLERMARQGQDVSAVSEDELNNLKQEAEIEAKKFAKTQLFLLTVAKKEELEVSTQEMNMALRQIAMRGGHDFKQVQEHYAKNNMLGALRDRIIADKAMEAIYAKAAKDDSATDGKDAAE